MIAILMRSPVNTSISDTLLYRDKAWTNGHMLLRWLIKTYLKPIFSELISWILSDH